MIINAEESLIGIVTSYDTTEYFRRRAEDMMFVEDIETTLRDFIRAAFNVSDDTDQQKLPAVIADMTDSDLRKKFQGALNHYLSLWNKKSDQETAKFDVDIAEEVFAKAFTHKDSPKSLDDLTLNDYIQLLLHNHFCIEWLERQRQVVLDAFHFSTEVNEPQQIEITSPIPGPSVESTIEEIIPVEEPLRPGDSRYAPLAIWLQQQPPREEKVTLTFIQIQEILREELPASARQHRSWWANDSVGHVQSRQWLDVGWRVSNIGVAEEKVTFTRIKERERLYIGFYSGLLQELRKVSPFQVREAGPDGLSWMTIAKLPSTGPQVGFLGCAFAWHRRFRIEFYIDSYDKEKNKRLFDMLYLRKDEIQAELRDIPASLEWERIDDKRASRIALYHEGAITNAPEELAQLRTWAVDAMVRFQKVIDQHVSHVLTTA